MNLFDYLSKIAQEKNVCNDPVTMVKGIENETILRLFAICDRELSEKEANAIIAFLESPPGQKLMEVSPKFRKVVEESEDRFVAEINMMAITKAIEKTMQEISDAVEETPGMVVEGVDGLKIITGKGGKLPYNLG